MNQEDPREPTKSKLGTFFVAALSLISFVVGLMAAVFGSQADVSPAESSTALICGIGLMLLGAMGAIAELHFRNRRISLIFLAFEAAAFVLLLSAGP